MRRRVPLSELEVERDEEAAAALAVLTESRLVTVDEGTVEVAHEALLREWPRLRAWLADDAEGRRLHQHLIHAAVGVGGLGARSRRALPRRKARLGARLGSDPRSTAQRAGARLPRGEPRRERARGRAPAADQPPPADAARRGRRAARRRGRRRGDRSCRSARARSMPPPSPTPSASAPRPSPRSASIRRCGSRAPASLSTTRSRPAPASYRRCFAAPRRSASSAPTARRRSSRSH